MTPPPALDLLAVDVSTGRWRRAHWPHPTVAGGLLGALLLQEWRGKGPAPVVLAGGAVSGRVAVAGATVVVCGRSPQSGGYAEARVEGPVGGSLRAAGLAALVLHGVAEHPVVVSLVDGDPEVIDGRDLRGSDVRATTEALRNRFPACTVGALGVAGEQHSAMASIVFDHGFPTASGGLGGSLGALSVKAVVLPAPAADGPAPGDELDLLTRSYAQRIDGNPLARSERDAPGFGVWAGPALPGYLGALNFSSDATAETSDAAGSPLLPHLARTRPCCPGCPQDCLKAYPAGASEPDTGRLHQLALPLWTSQLGMADPVSGLTFNAECHRLGLEHLSVGALLAVLAEARADDSADGGTGPRISFGDPEAAMRALRQWGARPGTVPGGSGRLADLGRARGRPDLVHAVKGMPLPPIDPRGAQGLAAAMVLNPSGPRYDVVEHDSDFDLEVAWPRHVLRGSAYGVPAGGLRMGTLGPDRTASLIGLWQLWSGLDVLGVCIFASPPTRELDEQDVLGLATVATGEHVSAEQLLRLGRQRLAVQRRLNHRWGIGEASERLPDRFHDRPVVDGRLRGTVVDREEFRATLTALREHFGWGDLLGGADDRDGVSVLAAAVRAAGVTS